MAQVVRWAALALAWALAACTQDGSDRCDDSGRHVEGSCDEGEESLASTASALTWSDLRAGRVFVIWSRSSDATAGSVTASAAGGDVRCTAGRCYAAWGGGVTLQAQPAAGYVFERWSGCSASTDASLTLSPIARSALCIAHFASNEQFTLSWSASPPEQGRVYATPSDPSADCTDERCTVVAGSTITLEAVAWPGFRLMRWVGCGAVYTPSIVVTVNADMRCEAEFFSLEGGGAPRFQALGHLPGSTSASYARGVSADGEVVVGFSGGEADSTAFRWTARGGLQALAGAGGRAENVSPDGRLVVGSIASNPDSSALRGAVVWRQGAASFERLTGPLMPPDMKPQFALVDALDVVDSGRIFAVCVQLGPWGARLACAHDGPGSADTMRASLVFSGDELGGYAGTFQGDPREGAGAVFNGERLPYPPGTLCLSPSFCSAEARAFSSDYGVVVGIAQVTLPEEALTPGAPLYDTAFDYTPSGGTQRLPDLEGGETRTAAFTISADGRIIGGYGSDESGQRAVIWVDRTPFTVEQAMNRAGGFAPAGWRFLDVRALSSDGRALIGNALNPDGLPEAYRIQLQRPPSPP